MTAPSLVLASASPIRADILKAAGLRFDVAHPGVDEAAIKRALAGEDLARVAEALAEAKALAVAAPGALVVGADQILECEGRAFDKPADRGAAAARLFALQGRSHTLVNSVVVARDGEIVFRRRERPTLAMRALTEREIDAYLDRAGPGVLKSVGAYQVEGLGAQLFERIEGDYFAVLGLSLLPLLGFLRGAGVRAF
jgi:septum formation protein